MATAYEASFIKPIPMREEFVKEDFDRLKAELRAEQRGITLYNASDRVVPMKCSGKTYKIYPEGMVPDPHTGKLQLHDGTLEVGHDMRQDEARLKKWREAGADPRVTPPQDVVHLTCDQVALHLVKKNAKFGICLLKGTPEEQEQRKRAARTRFREIKKNEAQARVLLAHKKAADAKALGLTYQMTADEVAAEQYLVEFAEDVDQQKRVLCRFKPCPFWHYDEAQVEKHIALRHKDELAGEIAAVNAAERAEALVEEKRGRRKSA